MRKVKITGCGYLIGKFCPNREALECGSWCPLFIEDNVLDEHKDILITHVKLMCGCEPVIFGIEMDERNENRTK